MGEGRGQQRENNETVKERVGSCLSGQRRPSSSSPGLTGQWFCFPLKFSVAIWRLWERIWMNPKFAKDSLWSKKVITVTFNYKAIGV